MGKRDMYLKMKDGKRPGWNGQVSAVWLTGLPDGEHTLRVTVTGEKHPESEGTAGSESSGNAIEISIQNQEGD
jgi:hypothetical protein